MAYQKRNFQKEQLLTAEDMNAMDAQIEKNESEASKAQEALKQAITFRSELNEEDDLNNTNQPGIYFWIDGRIPENSPVDYGAIMIQHQAGAFNLIVQTVICGKTGVNQKQRVCRYETWDKWRETGIDNSDALTVKRMLTDEDDLNGLLENGIYYYVGGNGVPKNAPFIPETTAVQLGSVQIIVFADTDGAPRSQIALHDGRYKYRTSGSLDENVWSDWKESAQETTDIMRYRKYLDGTDDMDNITVSGVYQYSVIDGNIPANAPFTIEEGTGVPTILVFGDDGSDITDDGIVQIAVAQKNKVPNMRIRTGLTASGSWTSWVTVNIESGSSGGLGTYRGYLNASNDMNDAKENGIYEYSEGDVPANAPFEKGGVSVIVYGSNNVDGIKVGLVTQIATSRYNNINYMKIRVGNADLDDTWSAWEDVAIGGIHYKGWLLDTDDLNDITENGIYSIISNEGNLPQNTPEDFASGSGTTMLVYGNASATGGIVQIISGADVYGGLAMPRIKFRMGNNQKIYTSWSDFLEITQETGDSETKVMSQKAITDILKTITGGSGDPGADYSNVIQTLSNCFTNGVFVSDDPDALKPTPGEGLQLITNPGTVLIEGYSKKMAKNTRTFSVKEEEYVEVYLLRLYTDTGVIERIIREVTVYGDVLFSREDSSELPVRWGGWYDILLSKVTIPAGATQITEDMIEDYRDNNNYCGHVRSKL